MQNPANYSVVTQPSSISGTVIGSAVGNGVSPIVAMDICLLRTTSGDLWTGNGWTSDGNDPARVLHATFGAPDASGRSTWTCSSPMPTAAQLTPDRYYIYVGVRDQANQTHAIGQFFFVGPYDSFPPQIVINSPVQHANLTQLSNVSGTATDPANPDGSAPSGVRVMEVVLNRGNEYWNGSEWNSGEGAMLPVAISAPDANGQVTWRCTALMPVGSQLSPGTYYVRVNIFDNNYNYNAVVHSFSVGSPAALSANQLQDGGFETPPLTWFQGPPLPGSPWTFEVTASGNAGLTPNNTYFDNGTAPEGTQVAFLQGKCAVKQTLSLAPGSYSLRFYAASRRGELNDFAVKIDGVVVDQFTINNSPLGNGPGWFELVTVPFQVSQGNHEVSIANLNSRGGDHTVFVDQVRLVKPSPQTGMGLLRAQFLPRAGQAQRMVGGIFQGSNDVTVWTDLAAITTQPPDNVYTQLALGSTSYRYLRYLAPADSYGNIAELEFYSGGTRLPGSGFGSPGSYQNNPYVTFDKALDGDPATYFDAPSGAAGYFMGIDTVGFDPLAHALIQGGFETPVLSPGSFHARFLPGSAWTFDTNSGIAANRSGLNNGTAPQGRQVAYMQPSGSIRQSAWLPAGSYSLRFLATSRGAIVNTYSHPESFTVKIDGTAVAQFVSNNASPGTWDQVATAPFSVTAGSHEIAITSNNGSGPHTLFVDRVQLVDPAQPLTPLLPPMGLQAIAGSKAVQLNWNTAVGATGYAVRRAMSAQGPWHEVARVNGLQATDTSVLNGTRYFYTVSSLRARPEAATPRNPSPVDSSAPTEIVSALPKASLSAPAHLVAQGRVVSGAGQVHLSWEAAAGAFNYQVLRQNGTQWQLLGTPTTTSYTDTPLATGATYTYLVRSVQDTTVSGDSNQAQVTLVTPPAAPTLTATSLSATGTAQIRLDWNLVSGAGAYLIRRSTRLGGPYALLERTPASSYVDSEVTDGQTYYYVVQAVASQPGAPEGSGDVVSASSNEAAATARTRPNTALQLRATPGDTTILLEWEGATEGASYEVWRSSNGGPWNPIASPAAGTEFYLDSGLVNGVPHTYLVRAVVAGNTGGGTGDSDTVTARAQAILPPQPDPVRIGLRTATTIEVILPAYRAAPLTLSMGTDDPYSGGSSTLIPVASGLSGGTTFTVTGLTPDSNYAFRVTAQNSLGQSPGAAVSTSTLPLPPGPPAAPHFARVTGTTLRITFTLPPGANSVRLERRFGSATAPTWEENSAYAGGSTSAYAFSVSDLTPDTTYTYRLVAIGGGGETPGPASSVTTAPEAPAAPVIEAVTATGLRVQRVATGTAVPPLPAGASSLSLQQEVVLDYDPYLGAVTEWHTLASGLTGNAAYTFSGLFPQSYLTLRYVAVGAAGETSGPSNYAYTTLGTAPTTPLAPLLADIDSQALTVTRLPVSGGDEEGGYPTTWVLQQLVGTSYNDIHTFSPSEWAYDVTGLVANTSYTFRFRIGATSGPTATARTAPAAPAAPTVVSVHTTSVDLTLPAAPTNVTLTLQYQEEVGNEYDPDFGWVTSASGLAGGASASVSGLQPGSTTRFRVIAVGPDASTTGAETAPVTLFLPALSSPPAPLAQAISPSQILVAVANRPPFAAQLWVQSRVASGSAWPVSNPGGSGVTETEITAFPSDPLIQSLQPATSYQIRFKASNGSGSVFSAVVTITTPPGAPAAPSIVNGSATGSGFQVTVPAGLPTGASSLTLQVAPFDYSSDPPLWRAVSSGVVPGQTPANGIVTVSGLSAMMSYSVRWVAVGTSGATPGAQSYVQTYTTTATAPGAPRFSDVTSDSVVVWPPDLQGAVAGNYGYGDTLAYTLQGKLAGETTYTDLSVAHYADEIEPQKLEGLTPGATYQFRFLQSDSTDAQNPGTQTGGTAATITLPTPSGVTWDVGSAISCAGIRYPVQGMKIRSGKLGQLNAHLATDWDVMQRLTNGLPSRSAVSDTCSYSWVATDGFFPEGSVGANVPWQAPTTPGFYTISLTVSDQSSANKGVGEGGTRADAAAGAADRPLHFIVRVQVIP